jgi:hypothetical protein
MLIQLKSSHRAVLAIALAGVMVASLAWLCARDPNITFLPGDGRAEWILFPSAPLAGVHHVADLSVVFRRQFVLAGEPQTAVLSVRAAKHFQLRLNTKAVGISPGANWKDISRADALAGLHTGTNTVEVRVFNDNAPPALWLVLVTDKLTLRSDQTWEATSMDSAWRQAALATAPRRPDRGNPIAGGGTTLQAVATVWPIWIIFGGLSMVIGIAGRRWFNRTRMPKAGATDWLFGPKTIVPLMIMAVLWVALFCNNARMLPNMGGFDKRGHSDYIDYIQKHWTPPLPNQGWEMFQPPLYYGISAVTLSVFRLSVNDAAGAMVLGWLTMLFGIMHIALVFLSLRLLFPGQIGRQWVGLILAAFLPMLLYLSHYVTNETLGFLSRVKIPGPVLSCLG